MDVYVSIGMSTSNTYKYKYTYKSYTPALYKESRLVEGQLMMRIEALLYQQGSTAARNTSIYWKHSSQGGYEHKNDELYKDFYVAIDLSNLVPQKLRNKELFFNNNVVA